MPHTSLLQSLGERVRQLREQRVLTLQDLADAAGCSRRFLVEIESGRANPSLRKLAALAMALGCTLAELCDLPLAPPPERYALVGVRGAGKSTLGRMLAQQLEVPFAELSELVERHRGLPRSAIFELEGPDGYRAAEAEALEDWLAHHGTGVLAAPGGIVDHPPTWERLLSTCRTVWVQARPEDHWQRVAARSGPRAQVSKDRAMAGLLQLLQSRSPAYGLADFSLDTSGRSPEQCLDQLRTWIQGGLSQQGAGPQGRG